MNKRTLGDKRLTQSTNLLPMARSMPKKLLPLPFHRNNIRYFTNEMKSLDYEPGNFAESKSEADLPNVNRKPIFKKSKYSLKNYGYICEKNYLEDSSWHKQQTLGHRGPRAGKLRLPPMKKTFRRRVNQSASKKERNRRQCIMASPLKRIVRRTNRNRKKIRSDNLTLAYSVTHDQRSNMQTLDFQLEERNFNTEQGQKDSKQSGVTRSYIISSQNQISRLKNSSQAMTFGKGSEDNGFIRDVSKRASPKNGIVNEEMEETESQVYENGMLVKKGRPTIVQSEVINKEPSQNYEEDQPINFESFEPKKETIDDVLGGVTEDESKDVSDVSRPKIQTKVTMEVLSDVESTDIDPIFADEEEIEEDEVLAEMKDEQHKCLEHYRMGKNTWKEKGIIKDGKCYDAVVLNYQILERKGRDNQVIHKENIIFQDFYDKYRHLDMMVERQMMINYLYKKGYIQGNEGRMDVSYAKPTNSSYIYHVVETEDEELQKTKFELMLPILKIFSNGNELKRETLGAMDIVYVCENGIETMVMPRLEGGEEFVEKVVEPIVIDDDELPVIELKCIADPRVKECIWYQDFLHKDEDETHGQVYRVSIMNFLLEYFEEDVLKKVKRFTFEQFYQEFKFMINDVQRGMALAFAEECGVIQNSEYDTLSFMTTSRDERRFHIVLEDDEENNGKTKIIIKRPKLVIHLVRGEEKTLVFDAVLYPHDICYLCENGADPLVKYKISKCHKKFREEIENQLETENVNQAETVKENQNRAHSERTFIMVKPDGVKRRLIGETIKKFEKRGLRLIDLKFCKPDRSKFEQHYEEHIGKPFFDPLVEYMMMGPVVQMILEGPHAIQITRAMIGKTRPHEADAATLRGDFGFVMRRNIVHGSDSVESGEREIGVWFSDSTVMDQNKLEKKKTISKMKQEMKIQISTVAFNPLKDPEEEHFSSDIEKSRVASARNIEKETEDITEEIEARKETEIEAGEETEKEVEKETEGEAEVDAEIEKEAVEEVQEDVEQEVEEQDENKLQRTFIMVKPDGVKRRLIGETIKKFEKRGLKLINLKFCKPDRSKFEQHYAEHVGKPFFDPLVEYMMMGPVVQMILEGPNAIDITRMMIGKTRPHESDAATIRGDYGFVMRRNIIHGSDSEESGEREIGVWFGENQELKLETEQVPLHAEGVTMERTFIMVKPDGVKRRLIGQTIKKFENRGLKLIDLKLCKPDRSMFEQHYAEHIGKSFFDPLVEYMMMGPVVQMILEGPNAVQLTRMMIGKTRPHESDAGTIRGDFGFVMRRNVIHGSDSVESGEREIGVWFKDSQFLESEKSA